MQNLCAKNSAVSSASAISLCVAGCQSWGNPINPQVHQSSILKSLSLKMGVAQHDHNSKLLNFQLQDQDSSSTQSSGQSYPEVASMGETSACEKNTVSTESGCKETVGKSAMANFRSVSSVVTEDFSFPTAQIDYSHSVAHFPFHVAEPFFTGLLPAPYGPQTLVHHPQIMGLASSRVPLPLDVTQDEPIYVNAKQYRAILRRRQHRAKLESENKLVKDRKPYLHESRHLHALKRARGAGGRFLNTKKVQESKPAPASEAPGYTHLHAAGGMSGHEAHQTDKCKDTGSSTSGSDVTSASNGDDIFQQPGFKFLGYPLPSGGAEQGYSGHMRGGGNQHHFSILH